jgi:tetratricopeptide (TPR) repeat protein
MQSIFHTPSFMHSGFIAVAFLQALFTCSAAFAGAADCGSLTNHFGPWDYYTARPADISIVETRHFTPEVEQLKSGKSGWLAGDISYTLGVFPNHPRALNSIANLSIREKRAKPEHSSFSVDCWFDRAIRFRPDDSTVRMIYAVYLNKTNKSKEALEQLEVAAKNDSDDANLNYNIGLVYFELKNYEKSLYFAHRAYELGFPLPGLKNKLQRAGKW